MGSSLTSKTEVDLRVEPVRVRRADRRRGERILDIVTDKEAPIARLRGRVLFYHERSDHIDFGSNESAVVAVDAVAGAGRRIDAAAAPAGDGIEVVAGVGQPEGVVIGREHQAR